MNDLNKKIKQEGDSFQGVHKNIVYYGLRNQQFGNWCGYVVIKPNHPFYLKDEEAQLIRVHGGITFIEIVTESLADHLNSRDIDKVYMNDFVIGFDCGHHGDQLPYAIMPRSAYETTYKHKDFVISSCVGVIDYLDNQFPEFYEEVKEMFRQLNS